MENEKWLPVLGWEDTYEVSDLGRVRSKDKIKFRSNGRLDNRKGKVLSPARQKTGYLTVSLWNGKSRKSYTVHRLVADAFCGKRIQCVHHKNAKRDDNRAENLEHTTNRQNTIEKWKRVKKSLTGASLCKGKTVRPWRSATKYNGKVICLGYYDTEQEASAAYHGAHKLIQAIEHERTKGETK